LFLSGSPSAAPTPAFALSFTSVVAFVVKLVGVVLCIVMVLVLGILVGGGPLIAKTIQSSIQYYDRRILGVDVTIESLKVRVHTGLVELKGLVVANAQGYDAKYLINVDRAVVDINMLKLFCSGFRDIRIQRLVFSNVDVIWEKSGLRHSNVKEVVDFLRKDSEKDTAAAPRAIEETQVDTAQPKSKGSRKVTLRKVKIEDVGVKMASHILHGAGVRFSLADINYAEFSADHGAYLTDDIIKLLLLSTLKTVVENTAGKSIGDHYF